MNFSMEVSFTGSVADRPNIALPPVEIVSISTILQTFISHLIFINHANFRDTIKRKLDS